MESSVGLEKCPYCGGDASVRGKVKAYARCGGCGVRTASFRYVLGDERSKEKAILYAIEAWNRRAKNG